MHFSQDLYTISERPLAFSRLVSAHSQSEIPVCPRGVGPPPMWHDSAPPTGSSLGSPAACAALFSCPGVLLPVRQKGLWPPDQHSPHASPRRCPPSARSGQWPTPRAGVRHQPWKASWAPPHRARTHPSHPQGRYPPSAPPAQRPAPWVRAGHQSWEQPRVPTITGARLGVPTRRTAQQV